MASSMHMHVDSAVLVFWGWHFGVVSQARCGHATQQRLELCARYPHCCLLHVV
jgi:hypothetical protein